MEPKLKLRLQLQVQDAGVISGFCYPYARFLLDKTLALKGEGRLYETKGHDVTKIGESVLAALGDQLPTRYRIEVDNHKEVDALIERAEEFLAIFEK